MTDTPHSAILVQADLARMTGYSRPAEIEAELERMHVCYKRGRRGIWTTVDALNAALGLRDGEPVRPRFRPRLDF